MAIISLILLHRLIIRNVMSPMDLRSHQYNDQLPSKPKFTTSEIEELVSLLFVGTLPMKNESRVLNVGIFLVKFSMCPGTYLVRDIFEGVSDTEKKGSCFQTFTTTLNGVWTTRNAFTNY